MGKITSLMGQIHPIETEAEARNVAFLGCAKVE